MANKYYRRLEKGETVEAGDEYLDVDRGCKPVQSIGWRAGDPDYGYSTIYRREVTAAFVLDRQLPDIRKTLLDCTSEERVAFFDKLTEGFCTACGQQKVGPCHCQRDE